MALAVALAALATLLAAGREEAAPRERLRWGIYQIYWGRRPFARHLESELAKFARRPDYVMFYRDLGRAFPRSAIETIRDAGATPIVSLELWHWHGRDNPSCLADIAAGKYDDFFRRWASDARDEGKPILLRFGFEMNGDWFTWSGDPAAFVKAWRRAYRIFREERATGVQWVWCPNAASVPDDPDNAMHRYYPGDAAVDWIALDGYNFGDDHDEWHRWESFASIFDRPLRDLARRYPDKPVLIGETGCPPGKRRPAWIREAYRWLRERPRIKGVVWFHYDKRREGEPDWRIDTSPESLRVFNRTFARPDPR